MKCMVHVFIASAFSKDDQGGNKAGVVFDRPDLASWQKMQIAKELGFSETAFVNASAVADFCLEYFTPEEEVPLCGHATIATFSVLHLLGKLDKKEYLIETGVGILRIQVQEDGMIFMEQNLPEYLDVLNSEEMGICLDSFSIEKKLPVQIVSTGLKDILLPIESEERLAALEPDFEAMAGLSKQKQVVGVHAFVLTENADFAEECPEGTEQQEMITAVCRNFAPLYGIDEESATGTSNCALACYLFRYWKKKRQYVFEQGHNLGAVSRIVVNLQYHEQLLAEGNADEQVIDAVFVGGKGYLVEERELSI